MVVLGALSGLCMVKGGSLCPAVHLRLPGSSPLGRMRCNLAPWPRGVLCYQMLLVSLRPYEIDTKGYGLHRPPGDQRCVRSTWKGFRIATCPDGRPEQDAELWHGASRHRARVWHAPGVVWVYREGGHSDAFVLALVALRCEIGWGVRVRGHAWTAGRTRGEMLALGILPPPKSKRETGTRKEFTLTCLLSIQLTLYLSIHSHPYTHHNAAKQAI
jgi:hypothetical protein